MALQLSESAALAKLETTTSHIQQLEVYKLRAERQLDTTQSALFNARREARNHTKRLRETIQSLRRQFAGALPLSQQEKFSVALASVQEDRVKAQAEKKKAEEERRRAEGRAQELEVKHQGLQELLSTLKDGKGVQKVIRNDNYSVHHQVVVAQYLFILPASLHQTGAGVAQENGRNSHTRVEERSGVDSPEGREPVPEKAGGRARASHLQAGE